MMAKMFYTMEEAKTTLAKSEEEVKQYAREGRLREFRDGPRLMFKADQVEQLKSELSSSGGPPDLGVSDSGGLIGLVDTTGASGTSITLSEADTGQSSVAGLGGLGGSGTGLRMSGTASGINLASSGTGMGLSGSGAGAAGGTGMAMTPGASGIGLSLKGDTGLAADLGLSGSLGGVPSPGRPGAGGSVAGSQAGRGGINVFGDEDATADPGAQTAISGGIREQVNLEGVGSGSGLLDLTRESDDTSLGAVLDEITPGATVRKPGMADTGAGDRHRRSRRRSPRTPGRDRAGLCPAARSHVPRVRRGCSRRIRRYAVWDVRPDLRARRSLSPGDVVFPGQSVLYPSRVWLRGCADLFRDRHAGRKNGTPVRGRRCERLVHRLKSSNSKFQTHAVALLSRRACPARTHRPYRTRPPADASRRASPAAKVTLRLSITTLRPRKICYFLSYPLENRGVCRHTRRHSIDRAGFRSTCFGCRMG